MLYNQYYISTVEEVDPNYHRSNIILHTPDMYILAEFDTMEQLDFFANTLGFSFTLVEEKPWFNNENNTYREYILSHQFSNHNAGVFWSLADLPDGVKPIKALSNGLIVTCYYLNDGEIIHIYRPNPNAKEVYKPLSIEEHIIHQRIYGKY